MNKHHPQLTKHQKNIQFKLKLVAYLTLTIICFTPIQSVDGEIAPIDINIEIDQINLINQASRTEQTAALPPASSAQTYILEVESTDILNDIQFNYPNIKLNKKFNTVFQGASITATDADLIQLKNNQAIKNIYKSNTYQVKLDDSVPFIGGEAIRNFFDPNHQHLTGKGIKIGIIDTGIDYTHPDLQPNYKGGFDVVDDDHDPMETTKAQGESTLHGTHVAGIIAANGKVKGVAPEAELYAYRALGPGGMGTSEQVIAAIEKAVEDGMDIINLSLGSSVNGPDYPTSIALDNAVEKGVIAVTSNGNSGPNLWTVGSPGTSLKAISVGASTPPLEIPYVSLSTSPTKPITLQHFQGSQPWNLTKGYKIIDGGLGTLEDLRADNVLVNNKALNANTTVAHKGSKHSIDTRNQAFQVTRTGNTTYPNDYIRGNIILIERGKIPFTEKVKNAVHQGAKAVLIYNNEKGSFVGSLEENINIPVAAISQEDGLNIKSQLKKRTTSIWLDTNKRQIQDQLADFSSRGPVTYSWNIKPDVVAPGVEIDSTVPDGYLALRGTSMSAPHVTGAAALIKQAHPGWTPVQVKASLMNTAKPLQNDKGKTYNPFEQGAGRIQVDQAIKASILAYPSSLAFGSIEQKDKNRNQKIKSINITLENKSAHRQKVTFEMPNYREGLIWKLPISFYLAPQEKRHIPVQLEIDTKTITKGLHHGTINIATRTSNIKPSINNIESNTNKISLPYLFVVGDPQHPRIMGFSFEEEEDIRDHYKYELYLPGGADELGIVLFEPTTLKYVGVLSHFTDVDRGVFEQKITRKEIPFNDGVYHVIVFASEGGIESIQEGEIVIGDF